MVSGRKNANRDLAGPGGPDAPCRRARDFGRTLPGPSGGNAAGFRVDGRVARGTAASRNIRKCAKIRISGQFWSLLKPNPNCMGLCHFVIVAGIRVHVLDLVRVRVSWG